MCPSRTIATLAHREIPNSVWLENLLCLGLPLVLPWSTTCSGLVYHSSASLYHFSASLYCWFASVYHQVPLISPHILCLISPLFRCLCTPSPSGPRFNDFLSLNQVHIYTIKHILPLEMMDFVLKMMAFALKPIILC